MTEQYFLHLRENAWNDFEALLSGGNKNFKQNAFSFVQNLHAMTSDLNTAKANAFDPAITERLNALVREGNHILYRQRSNPLKEFSVFLFRTFPHSVRKNFKVIAACHLIFYGLYIFFMAFCAVHTDLAEFLVDGEQQVQMKEMYNPDSAYYLSPRGVSDDADMFGFYIFNNVSIAFRTFASGFFAGIGSLASLIFNAVFLGAVSGIIIDAGFSSTFFSFVIGHSSFELTGIILSAASGLILGYSFFFPHGMTRTASLSRCGKNCVPLIGGAAVLTTLAAVVEAFWSSRHEIPAIFHYIAGAFFWILLILYFIFCGRKNYAR
ncbi:MAG: stage II sporulation protein M [Termitinemataceae bacterium]|nr:MAG: stage II sporulation protein M [Termitinemataceae bacterium]